jgi:chromosome segregation ATPase
VFTALALALAFLIGGTGAYAVPDAVLRASGDLPAAKTEQTVKAEKELARLTEKEKGLKSQISAATINRSKLLSQKRAELKAARLKRDEAIKKEIEAIKTRKERQEALIRDLKKQLAELKKITKSKVAAVAAEAAIAIAQSKLDGIKTELKQANDRLSKSYQDYKTAYDRLTYLDGELKKILDMADGVQKKITAQKADYKNVKSEYAKALKAKDFLLAQRRMDSLVFIQQGVNNNYEMILDYRMRFKSDYQVQIVNYKV